MGWTRSAPLALPVSKAGSLQFTHVQLRHMNGSIHYNVQNPRLFESNNAIGPDA